MEGTGFNARRSIPGQECHIAQGSAIRRQKQENDVKNPETGLLKGIIAKQRPPFRVWRTWLEMCTGFFSLAGYPCST
jgi:hypothetical protein